MDVAESSFPLQLLEVSLYPFSRLILKFNGLPRTDIVPRLGLLLSCQDIAGSRRNLLVAAGYSKDSTTVRNA